MSDAGIYFVWSDLVEGIFYLFRLIEFFIICKLAQSFSFEYSFDLTEDAFDRVIVRRVGQIEDGMNVQGSVSVISFTGLMHR